MKYKIVTFYMALVLLAFQSCKLDESNNEINKTIIAKKNKSQKLSLSQMQYQNGKVIDSVEKRVLAQVKQRDFATMFKEADTSLVKKIGPADVKTYFKMIDKFYGQLDTLKIYGTASTANGKTLDYIANYSTGDSLELSYSLRFYNQDVKLSYITMNRFSKNAIPKNVISLFKPKLENIFSRKIELVYDNCTTLFKTTIPKEKIKELLDKNLMSNNNSYELIDCKPLIFGKNQVGFLAKTQKKLENGVIKKVNVVFFLEDNQNYKIADIQINK